MFNFAMTILLVLGLFLGSGSATLAMAQTSMPDEALYPLKIWSEDSRLRWGETDQDRLQLMIEFNNRRMEEIRTMLQNGQVPPEAVLTRTQNQLEYALRLAAGLPEEESTPALLRLQDHLQLQLQVMMQLRLPDNADPALLQVQARIRTMLTERVQLAGQGIEDPLWLREQLQIREQQRLQQESGQQEQNQYQNQEQNREQNQECQLLDCQENQQRNNNGESGADTLDAAGDNPWVDGTPTPYSSYGPGESQNPWTDLTPTPGSDYGPGESQNPWTEQTPTPGTGYGPGPGPDVTCTPQPNNGPVASPSPATGGNGEKP